MQQDHHDAWFRAILYSIGDAVITVDEQGTVLQMNHIAEQLTGWKESEATGKYLINVFQIVNEESRKPVKNPVDKILREGTVVGLANHTILISKDGTEIPIAESGAPIRNNDGKILGVVLVFRDQTKERENERKIRESERRLSTLMANLPGLSYRCQNDRNWTMEFLSEGCQQLTGYNSEDLIGNKKISYNDIIHPDDREYLWNTWQRVLQTNNIFEEEYRILTKDGPVKWVWERGHGVFSDDGELVALEGFITDITGKKLADEALRQTQQMLDIILNTIPVRVFWKDRNGIYLGCNKPFALDAGLSSPKDIIGKDDYQVGWIDQAELYRADDRVVIESGHPKISYEEPQTAPDGSLRWLRTSKIPLRNVDGEIIGVLGTYEDITEQKQAENALRESEQKFRTLFEESKDAIFITTPKGKIHDINPAGVEMLGFASKEEILAIDIAKDLYWNPEDRDEYIRTLNKNGYIKDYEIALKRNDGSKILVMETATLVRDKTGKPVIYRGIIRDITQQRLLEDQLRNVQKMESIGTLAGGIAHDFNNILGIIVGHAALIQMNFPDTEKINQSIDAIQTASDRGASLVQQLLTFARKTDVVYDSIKIDNVINEIVQLLRETLPKKIEIKVELDDAIPSITADITQIHQVLLNLTLNARDAMPDGGVLTISSRVVPVEKIRSKLIQATAKEYIKLTIADTGTGMDEQTKQRIFDPFFTTKEPGKGSGLGLALVYSIIENYKGIIEVESKPGYGTTFKIYLPVRQNIQTSKIISNKITKEKYEGTEKILIIEDEEMLRDSLKTILRDRGYTVITARDGEEGLQLYLLHLNDLFGNKIDLVITDLGMPKIGGEEVIRKIKIIDPKAKILLASGYIDPDRKVELKKAGAKLFLQKPYLPDEVLRALRKILDAKEL